MKRITNIDIIRIFAAFLVLSVHIGYSTGFIFSVGARGVQLFFILSGYLAFLSLNKGLSTISYYKHRIIRIIPTYWFCLVLVFSSNFILGKIHKNPGEILLYRSFFKTLRYFFGLQCVIPEDNWSLWSNYSALWTMSSFIFFYLVAPFLHKVLKNFYLTAVATVIMLLLTPSIASVIIKLCSNYPPEAEIELFAYNNPLTELHCFLFGSTLYYAIKENKSVVYCLILLAILVMTEFRYYCYECIFSVMIIIAVSFGNIITNEKTNKLIMKLSESTFTLYLVHPLMLIYSAIFWRISGIKNLIEGVDANLSKIIYIIFVYTSCISTSFLLYHGMIKKIENNLKSFFIKKVAE